MKPYQTTNLGKKVSKAGKAYLQHAASLQVHFLEVTAMVKKELRQKLHEDQGEHAADQESIFTSVYNWFVAAPAQPEESKEGGNRAILSDKDFLKALKREMKIFEVCIRIFEEECI